jgi:hypothetical protein
MSRVGGKGMTELEPGVDEGRFFVPSEFDEVDHLPDLVDLQRFNFPGPISEAFFHDNSFVSFIQGPYGSAKTTTCFFKLLARAMRMPICKDGKRHYRALVLRDTYRRMERTAIRSWQKWFPPSAGEWAGGQDRPSKHILNIVDLEGVELVFEIEFAAVGDLDVEDFMGGYEVTDMFLNEANLQKQEVLTYGSGRCGRFPSIKDLPADLPLKGFPGYTISRLPPGMKYESLPPGAIFDYGIIGDLNAPEYGSWLLEMKFGRLDPGAAQLGETKFFRQPGGREPGAENIQHLPPGYYQRLAAANAHQMWWVARMIDNKPGFSRHGKPVYHEYNEELHCPELPIPLLPHVPLEFGFDGGLHPAAVVGQRGSDGQMRIVKEFYLGRCGPTRFAEAIAEWIDGPAKGIPIAKQQPADPTAFDGVDEESGELGFIDIVQNITGLRLVEAPSNEPGLRQDAVRQELVYLIDGKHPALVICKSCVWLHKGMASDYRFSKIQRETGEEHSERPIKNEASNPQDALQYLMLFSRGIQAVVRREHGGRKRDRAASSSVTATTDFDVFS